MKKAMLLLIIPMCWLLLHCSGGQTLPPLARDAVILCFGDSITFGTGAEAAESYPSVLEKLVGRKVVKSGVPGEVSAEGLRRLPGVLDLVRPQLMVLCLGCNDLRKDMDREALRDNLRRMLALAKQRDLPVVLVTVPDVKMTFVAPRGFEYLAHEPPGLYADLAREFGAPLETGILERIINNPELKADTLHPNAAGYRMMAEAVADVLRKSGAIR